MRLAGWLIAGFLFVGTSSAQCATHAILVGINNYTNHTKLLGAVNDANSLADTLRPLIDGQFTLLLEEDANRAGFDAAWETVFERAELGDTLIFSFSGHGVADTDDDAYRDEADGLDEFLVLQPAPGDLSGPDLDEYVRDDELFELFKRAQNRGITVLFLADACHAGGLARDVLSSAVADNGLPFRFTRFKTKSTEPAPVASGHLSKPELTENVVFVSATSEKRRLQEVLLDHKPHGALSYYAAAAFTGAADANGDGILTVREFGDYVIPLVVMTAGDRQIPELDGEDLERGILQVPVKNPPIRSLALPKISLAVLGGENPDTVPDGTEILATPESKAELYWDRQKGALFNPFGDQLAPADNFQQLQRAIDAMRVGKGLREIAAQANPLSISLHPDDRLFTQGCQVRFSAESRRFHYYTAVNLTASGFVQFLYPLSRFNDPLKWNRKGPWRVKSIVDDKFGANFLIFVASEKPFVELHKTLESGGDQISPLELYEALTNQLQATQFEIGLKGAYTAPEGEACLG